MRDGTQQHTASRHNIAKGDVCMQIAIRHEVQTVTLRSLVERAVHPLQWPETVVEELVICACEIAQNIIDHGGGRGTLRMTADAQHQEFRMVAEDRGAGIDVRWVFRPHRPGDREGLSTIGRMMDFVMITYRPGGGTRIEVRRWAWPSIVDRTPKILVLQRPYPGEHVSGDVVCVQRHGNHRGVRVSLIDGLGHGSMAHVTALHAVQHLETALDRPVPDVLDALHRKMTGTRGAAVAIADLDLSAQTVQVGIVGNVRVVLFCREGTRRSFIGMNAVLGYPHPRFWGRNRVPIERATWRNGDCMALFSDGISSRFDITVTEFMLDPIRAVFRVFALCASAHDDASLVFITPQPVPLRVNAPSR